MRFVALFPDAVDPAALDPALTRAHFDHIAAHADRIVDAGGLRPAPDAPFCGALWVIEAESLAAAQALADGDPYARAGLWPNRRVMVWNRAPRPAPATHGKGGNDGEA